MTEEIKQILIKQVEGAYKDKSKARDAAFSNASLAAMQLMLAAKAKGLDTCRTNIRVDLRAACRRTTLFEHRPFYVSESVEEIPVEAVAAPIILPSPFSKGRAKTT
ncbi:Putative NAD(P)H nitroreductase yodC [Mycobacteroides abscessus subsp. abscessus]|nr:Putative NAD(P)H nitroreductase yodC [Mycobacteroides abscessus subsp. abscessus]